MSRIAELVARNRYLESAVFIVGSGRSGTTLLQTLLDDHPDLLVWPFEYPYYHYAAIHERESGKGPWKGRDLSRFYGQWDVEYFGGEFEQGLGKSFSLAHVSKEKYFATLAAFDDELLTRREFIQLMVYAYHQAWNPALRPKQFVMKHNSPRDEIFHDFPAARVIHADRHPFSIYISVKNYYRKIAGTNPSSMWTLGRSHRSNFKYGLVETAVVPVVHAHDWYQKHKSRYRCHRVTVEDLQSKPEVTMRGVAEFLGISWSEKLIMASVAGKPYGSNLSSGDDSAGRIVKQENEIAPARLGKALVPYEWWWIRKELSRVMRESGYEDPGGPELGLAARAFEFWRPMKFEFTRIAADAAPGTPPGSLLKCLAHYIINRIFFLIYSTERFLKPGRYFFT